MTEEPAALGGRNWPHLRNDLCKSHARELFSGAIYFHKIEN